MVRRIVLQLFCFFFPSSYISVYAPSLSSHPCHSAYSSVSCTLFLSSTYLPPTLSLFCLPVSGGFSANCLLSSFIAAATRCFSLSLTVRYYYGTSPALTFQSANNTTPPPVFYSKYTHPKSHTHTHTDNARIRLSYT